jgi:hypothetical protein
LFAGCGFEGEELYEFLIEMNKLARWFVELLDGESVSCVEYKLVLLEWLEVSFCGF